MIERHIDYVQFTANMQETEFKKEEYEAVSGVPYYPRGYRDASGARFNFGSNKGANCFIVLAGEALQNARDNGLLDSEVLAWAFSNGGKVSRIDLAVTEWIEERLFTLKTVETWWKKSLIDSSLCAGGCKEIAELCLDGKRERQTIYVGDPKKRAKKGIFRAYDKGIDLGIGSEIATRIELELKREKAHLAAKRIEQSGDIAGNFRTYFDVRHQEFDRIMDTAAVIAKRGQGKPKTVWEDEQMKRWEWLINQVAPALKDAIETDKTRLDRDDRLTQFLIASGLMAEMNVGAEHYAHGKIRDILEMHAINTDKKE